ncbi:MAG: M48 family metalloprotease [Capsulimonadaceae bacterium]|nr:M48 family metalloprotease [Capsulimonadaceae bacterium]
MPIHISFSPRVSPAKLLAAGIGLLLGIGVPLAVNRASLSPPVHADMQDEVKMGKEAEAQVLKTAKIVTDPATVARVQGIFARLKAVADTEKVPAGFGNDTVYNFDYRVRVIDAPDINAFSLPGGAVFIYSGLLKLLVSDDEIAAVLGHETAHAAHHHVAQLTHEERTMTTQMALGILVAVLAKVPADSIGGLATEAQYAQLARLNNHFSEAAEEDADHTGMIYMVKAGFNPLGMLVLLQRLKDVEERSPTIDLGFLQDHPLTDDRLAAANRELTELGYRPDPALLWTVSNAMRTRITDVTTNGKQGIRVSFGRRSIAVIAPSNRSEALSAAAAMDDLMSAGGQGYQVRSSGSVVFAGGKPIFNFTDQDAQLQPVATTPEEMAKVAVDIIKKGLWEVSVRGIMAQ